LLGDIRNTYTILIEVLKRRDYSGDVGLNRIILKWILTKNGGRLMTGLICLGTGTVMRIPTV
jgi:hypothetical protein